MERTRGREQNHHFDINPGLLYIVEVASKFKGASSI
jgi:hypothetical protein